MDEDRIINTDDLQRKADKVRKGFADEEVRLLRIRAKSDLFFLGDTILGFDRLHKSNGDPTELHGNFCSWMNKTRSDRFRLILMPRGNLKTTLNTISDGIQIVLPDDIGNQPFPRNLGTNARVLLAHEVENTAKENLHVITQKIYEEEFLVALFPELVPGKGLRVNQTNLDLPRTKGWPESTFTVMGRGAAGQGKHFDIMKINDIVGLNAMQSVSDYASAKLWVQDLKGMYTSMTETHIDYEGVRYRKDDIYAFIKEMHKDRLKIYTRSIWERNDKNEKVLIWPEGASWEDIKEIQETNPALFNAQYMNNPMEIEGEFSQEWERYYEKIDRFEILVTNPITNERTKIDTRDLDKLIMIDPALTGFSGIAVTGTDRNGVTYILEAIQEKFKTESLIAKVFQLNEIWNPRAVVVEKVLFSALYEPLFKAEMRLRSQHFRIIMVTTKQKQKEDRVRILRPWFANGKIYFEKNQESLISQYRDFPSVQDYHILDVLAYGPEVWRASAGNRESDDREEAVRKFGEARSKSTGYSAIRYSTR